MKLYEYKIKRGYDEDSDYSINIETLDVKETKKQYKITDGYTSSYNSVIKKEDIENIHKDWRGYPVYISDSPNKRSEFLQQFLIVEQKELSRLNKMYSKQKEHCEKIKALQELVK